MPTHAELPHALKRARVARRVVALCLTPLLGLAALSQAAIQPRAQAAVDHYIQATGGAAALEAERTLHTHGRIEAIGL